VVGVLAFGSGKWGSFFEMPIFDVFLGEIALRLSIFPEIEKLALNDIE